MGIVIGPTLGPTVGGMIIDNYNWPLIFYINVPFGIVASILSYRFVDNSNEMKFKPDIDWYGILLLTIGIGSLQYVLERGQTEDWYDSAYIRWATFTAVTGIILFIWWELKHKHPIVNLRILKNPTLVLTTILTFMVGICPVYFGICISIATAKGIGLYGISDRYHLIAQLYIVPGIYAFYREKPSIGHLA